MQLYANEKKTLFKLLNKRTCKLKVVKRIKSMQQQRIQMHY